MGIQQSVIRIKYLYIYIYILSVVRNFDIFMGLSGESGAVFDIGEEIPTPRNF